ncbi:hypothetical protein GCM10009868_05520 [Terrabacter aerolatus]|uniref:Lipoprotein n=1 Tax=Terrabacter aerolatus TaxID=422442 RepID=A0A512D0R9_9MICO|nr:hypothetical protein [Terrabacter aerolatus]GEO30059.1 hypothetical protein TAE01_18690 [Terrabacter aerolatus]
MLRRLTLASAAVALALPLAACSGSNPDSSPEAAAHPSWAVVAETVCPSSGDHQGSLAEHRVTCTSAAGKPLEASFYDQPVELDRRVHTFECTSGTKSVVGKDWMVPAVTDEKVVARLLDAGGINLC